MVGISFVELGQEYRTVGRGAVGAVEVKISQLEYCIHIKHS